MADTFRLTEYLKRIGIDGTVKPDFATLTAIHAAHVDAIPFEGLDPFLGRQVKLDLAGFRKKSSPTAEADIASNKTRS